jgi:ElaB/YqjD/DUF883 family membrane-anchored ribosome-binding protein
VRAAPDCCCSIIAHRDTVCGSSFPIPACTACFFADNNWISVCWSAEVGLFVTVAQSGVGNRVMTSPDGVTWTARSSAADNNWLSVCWSAEVGLFVAVALSGTRNRVMTSPDGITWTARTSAADNTWFSVCWSPQVNRFVAVASSGSGNRVMTSGHEV